MNGNELTCRNFHLRSPAGARDESSGLHLIDGAATSEAIASCRPLTTLPAANRARAKLVLVEAGAGIAAAAGREEALIETQAQGEAPIAWARRVIEQLGSAEQSGLLFKNAVVLLGNHFDSASMTARHVIARTLLAHARVCRRPTFDIVLSLPKNAQGALRDGVLTLVELLVSNPEASSAVFHVRFDGVASPS